MSRMATRVWNKRNRTIRYVSRCELGTDNKSGKGDDRIGKEKEVRHDIGPLHHINTLST